MKLIKRVAKSSAGTAAILVALRLSGAAAGMAFALLMARTMGAQEMGQAVTALAAAMFLSSLTTGSSEPGAPRFITQYLEHGDPGSARGFIRLNWRVFTGLLPLSMIGAIAIYFHGGLAPEFALVPIAAAVMGALRIGAAHALGFGRVVVSVAPGAVIRQFCVLGLFALYAAAIGAPSPAMVVAFLIAGALCAFTVQQAALRPQYNTLMSGPAQMTHWRTWLTTGWFLGPTLLFIEYSREVLLFFSAFGVPPETVATLSVATAITGFARFGIAAVNQSVTPALSRAIARGDSTEMERLIFGGNLLKLAGTILALIVLVVFGEHIMAVFGPAFIPAAALFPVLMVEMFALAVLGPGSNVLALSGHHRLLPVAAFAALMALAAGSAAAGALYGAVGIAWTAGLVWTFWSLFLAFVAQRRLGFGITLFHGIARRLRGSPRNAA
ncbi:MAG: hypothetical protein AAGF45_02795 [Pseudomonadota bacterium]